jgi:hypothetical protein
MRPVRGCPLIELRHVLCIADEILRWIAQDFGAARGSIMVDSHWRCRMHN